MFSFLRNRYDRTSSFLRRHSQAAALVVGLVIAIGAATAWYGTLIGTILGPLLVGIGTSVIAAAITAYLGPFSETAFRRFISLGIEKVWPSRDAVPERDWVDSLIQADHTCTLLGVAHGNWCRDSRFLPALTDRLEHGVYVEILFLDPDSSLAEVRTREEGKKRDTKEAIRESIECMWNFRNKLEAEDRNRLRLYVYNATPSCGLMWIDDHMIVTHYLAGLPDLTSPAVRLKPAQIGTGGLFDVYAKNLENIKNGMSTEIDERNIQQFLPKTGIKAVGPVQATPD